MWESVVVGVVVAVAAAAVAGKLYQTAAGKGKSSCGGACGKCPTPKPRRRAKPEHPAAPDDASP